MRRSTEQQVTALFIQAMRTALNLMTPAQKMKWAAANERDNLVDFGTTRAHEREEAIKRAEADQC